MSKNKNVTKIELPIIKCGMQIAIPIGEITTNEIVQDLMVRIETPAGVSFDSITKSHGTYDENTGVWTIGTLLPMLPASAQINFIVEDDTLAPFVFNYEVDMPCDACYEDNEHCVIIKGITCSEIAECISMGELDCAGLTV